MFKIFALVTTLVAGPAGPAGTHFFVAGLPNQFPSKEACERAVRSPSFSPIAQSLGAMFNSRVKPVYKNNLKAVFVCTDDPVETVVQKFMGDAAATNKKDEEL